MRADDIDSILAAARQQFDEALATHPNAAGGLRPEPATTAVYIHGGSVGAVHTAPVTIHSQTLNFTTTTQPKEKGG